MKRLEKYIDRSYSVISGEKGLEHLKTFKDFPVFFGCTDSSFKDDLYADMKWAIDPSTGIIQLEKLIPLDILYMEQHVDATGETWRQYNNDFSDYIVDNSEGNIIEIGGGAGKIANLILRKTKTNQEIIVVEPNPLFKEKKGLRIINSFFNKGLKEKLGSNNTVSFSQVFEHIYDPKGFLEEIYEFLPENGKLIFAYPNLEYWFNNKFTNAINFEHTLLMTDYYVDYLLKVSGFEIIEKKAYKNHSHFYNVKKTEKTPQLSLKNKYKHYKNMFEDFISYHNDLVREINIKTKNQSELFLFGGHIFSQFLIQFGLDVSNLEYVLDNSPLKINKRLYGTELQVKSPAILAEYKAPTVILKAGVYNDEIKKDILENINPNTKFI